MPLSTENVSLTYRTGAREVAALRDVNLRVGPGELVAVSGPSGSGKTTLLMVLGGLLRPDSGTVRFDGEDVYALPAPERNRFRNRRIGFVFQQFHLIPYLSVEENVLTPSLAGGEPAAAETAEGLLRRFGLLDRRTHRPAELSTGEKQRVALARALLQNPAVVLADEPTGNLDEDNGRTVMEHLAGVAREGRAVLVVSHDPRVKPFASRVLRLVQGRIES